MKEGTHPLNINIEYHVTGTGDIKMGRVDDTINGVGRAGDQVCLVPCSPSAQHAVSILMNE